MNEILLSGHAHRSVPVVGPYRYVRLENMRHPASGGQAIVAIAALRIIDTNTGTNWALGGIASAHSRFNTSYTWENGIDASTATMWISTNNAGVLTEVSPVWYQVDLQEPREFNSILISGRDTFGQVPGKFDIMASVDGTNWTLLRRLTKEVVSAFGNLTEVLQ